MTKLRLANRQPTIVNVSIVGIFVILLFAALFYARGFLLPIVLASLFAITFAPLVRRLRRYWISPWVSSLLLAVALALIIAGLSTLVSEPFANMVDQAPKVASQLRHWFASFGQPFAVLNRASRDVAAIAGGDDGTHRTVVMAGPSVVSWVAGTLAGFGTTIAAALLLVPFFLSCGDLLKSKLVHVLPGLTRKKQSLIILRDIENEVSRYLLTMTLINAVLGCVIGGMMALLGMPNPILWGVGAMLLNFIPYAGALAGIVLALAVATVTFDHAAFVVIPPLSYMAVQILEGAFITPAILGRRLALNALAILFMLALTGWIWGVVGAIIAVPLLIVIKAFTDQFPSLSMISVFLSPGSPVPETTAEVSNAAQQGAPQ